MDTFIFLKVKKCNSLKKLLSVDFIRQTGVISAFLRDCFLWWINPHLISSEILRQQDGECSQHTLQCVNGNEETCQPVQQCGLLMCCWTIMEFCSTEELDIETQE